MCCCRVFFFKDKNEESFFFLLSFIVSLFNYIEEVEVEVEWWEETTQRISPMSTHTHDTTRPCICMYMCALFRERDLI